MEKSKTTALIAPVIVLVAICLVASALLAGANQMTAPTIAIREAEAASQARTAVLPEGNGFTAYTGELAKGIIDAYSADNGEGIVCQTSFNGFNGAVKLMIGIDKEGKVRGVQVMSHSETPGVGTNALTESYLGQYSGQTEVDGIDAYSGASFSSKAVKNGINAALTQFSMMQ